MGKYSGKKCRLLTMFSLTTTFFLVEIIVGYITNSMALVADSFHMLSDIVALVVAFLAVRMSPKKWSKNTFGWARAEVLGALVNSVFLIALCFSIFVEALKRFYEKEDIHNPKMILVVGVLGLVVNVVGLGLFANHSHGHSHGGSSHGHSHGGGSATKQPPGAATASAEALPATARGHLSSFVGDDETDGSGSPTSGASEGQRQSAAQQMNMRGVFLHVLADAIGSVIVVISALVIWLTKWEYRMYIDPALSVVMVCLILRSVWPLLVDSSLILLQTVPTHIQVDRIEQKLLREVEGVLAVHEFHIWQLAGDRIIASAHVRCHNLTDYMSIAEQIKQLFHNEGIHSTTIQPEFVDYAETGMSNKNETCILDCPPSELENCGQNKCCSSKKQSEETQSLLWRRPGSGEDAGDVETGLLSRNRPGSAGP